MNKEIIHLNKKFTSGDGQVYNLLPICGRDKSKRLILEIGSGKTPFIIEGKRKIETQEHYFGIDINPYKTRYSALMLGVPYSDKFTLMTADARNLPLRDGSVDEVVMCNVVGDSRVKEEGEPLIIETLGGNNKSIAPKAYKKNNPGFESFIEKITRVLDQNGTIVFVETYSPFITSVEELEKLMKKYGFSLKNRKNMYDPNEIKQYAEYLDLGDEPYVAKFSRL